MDQRLQELRKTAIITGTDEDYIRFRQELARNGLCPWCEKPRCKHDTWEPNIKQVFLGTPQA